MLNLKFAIELLLGALLSGSGYGYYYKKDNSTLEEDFFVRTKNELLPVEVKSNQDGSKSLSALIKNENYGDIHHGIKLGNFNIGYANNIYTFPYFCAFMMKAFLKALDNN